uniref:Fatty-acid amide hydrolase 1 n=1 Tax=Callorhinchus milii TaxID=7868 RepID=V9KM32_CALMI
MTMLWLQTVWVDLKAVPVLVLVCCVSLTMALTSFMKSTRYKRVIPEARTKRIKGLEEMRRAVEQHKVMGNSGVDESILHLTLRELCKQLKEGSLTPASVLYSYMEKALEVTKELNCITDYLSESQAQVKELGESGIRGMLYGIPISIKDNLFYKGHDSTCGLSRFINKPEEEDSIIVQVLKKQGAIPFVKTNVPQSLLSYECSNPIFGSTANPYNGNRTSGGSSGGEGALIAGGGSILGFGSDIGGSIRFPASFCGICGFKPTANRLSKKGIKASVAGQKTLEVMIGPMARDVDSLALCMKALLCEDMFRLDPTVPPIPFKDEIYSNTKMLRIGYFESDGYWIPNPSMRRAIRETKQLLEEAGHTLIPFTPPKTYFAMNTIIIPGILADGGASLLKRMDGDIIDPNMKQQFFMCKIPTIIKKILSFLLKPFSPRIADFLKAASGVSSVTLLWEYHNAAEVYSDEYMNQWKKQDLDVLLCPSLGPAFKFGYAGKLIAAASGMSIFNLLNYPAGIVPVSKVSEQDEEELKHYTGYNNDFWDRTFKKAVMGGVGLPLAVQCVALPWQDELCLYFMREVERLVCAKKGI